MRAELKEPHLSLFLKVLCNIVRLAKLRHAFAHGVWGTVEALPDALLLIDAEHLFRHWGATNDLLAVFTQSGPSAVSPVHLDNRHIEVWTETDLKDEIAHMNQAVQFAFALERLASDDTFDVSNARRGQAYNWLLQQAATRHDAGSGTEH